MIRLHRAIRFLTVLALSAAVTISGTNLVQAQEHPEHPTKETTAKKEHPEHPAKESAVDKAAIAEAIRSYVETDCKLKGGPFLVYDPASKSALQLTLTKVHEERLAQVGDNLFFACSDFDAVSGKTFDLDFFMSEQDGKLVVTEVMIHKEDGTARYTWYEEDGIWKHKKS